MELIAEKRKSGILRGTLIGAIILMLASLIMAGCGKKEFQLICDNEQVSAVAMKAFNDRTSKYADNPALAEIGRMSGADISSPVLSILAIQTIKHDKASGFSACLGRAKQADDRERDIGYVLTWIDKDIGTFEVNLKDTDLLISSYASVEYKANLATIAKAKQDAVDADQAKKLAEEKAIIDKAIADKAAEDDRLSEANEATAKLRQLEEVLANEKLESLPTEAKK